MWYHRESLNYFGEPSALARVTALSTKGCVGRAEVDQVRFDVHDGRGGYLQGQIGIAGALALQRTLNQLFPNNLPESRPAQVVLTVKHIEHAQPE